MKRQKRRPSNKPALAGDSASTPARAGGDEPATGLTETRPSQPPLAKGMADFLGTEWNRGWLPIVLLVTATVIAYLPVWHAGFIWDDDAHLTNNPCIVGPLGFKSIWTSSAAVYYPLVLTSFWVQHALWGLNPLPYHLVNIAMHAACALLLWQALRRLNVRGAWMGATLWALHPAQVESVAWITELKNTQSCFFYLLAILWFMRWRAAGGPAGPRGNKQDYALALLCGTLAILSKASTVMLPVVLGLCWWWMEGRWRWCNWLRLAPFFLISGAASGWTIWEQKFHSAAIGPEWAQTWPERLVIAGKALWFYLGKLCWPHPLVFIYPRWAIDASWPAAYLPVLAAAFGLFVFWRNRNGRMRPWFFAFAYFLVSLFPVLGFFNVYFFRYSFVGDHFQYLASIGPSALVAAGLATGLDFFEKGRPFLKPALYGILLAVLGVLTWRQSGIYIDVETLWQVTIARNPDCWMARNNLGYALYKKGKMEEAIRQFQEAIHLKPDNAEAHYNFAVALGKKGQIDEAISQFQVAIRLKPDDAEAAYNLGVAFEKKGQIDEAIHLFQKAIRLKPDYAEAHYNFAVALGKKDQIDEAISQLQEAIRLKPDYAEAHLNLAVALSKKGRMDEAISQFQDAIRLKLDNADAHHSLGIALMQRGRVREAIAHYQISLKRQPDDARTLSDLAWMLATCPEASIRDGVKAIDLAQQANRLSGGNDPMILSTLAAAEAEAGRYDEAIQAAQEALRLAETSAQLDLTREIRAQLKLYQAGRPYRD